MNNFVSKKKITIIVIVAAMSVAGFPHRASAQNVAPVQKSSLDQQSILNKIKDSIARLKSKMSNNNNNQKVKDLQLKLKQAQADSRRKQDDARAAMERARVRQQQNMQSLKSQLKQR